MNPLTYIVNMCRKAPKLAHPMVDRRDGIPSACDEEQDFGDIDINEYHKDDRSRILLTDSLLANDFLRNLMDANRVKLVVDAMYPLEYEIDSYIIKEGDIGSHLFVSAEGSFEVLKGGVTVKRFAAGEAFGELAILYDINRGASVRATSAAKVWALERIVFKNIMRVSSFREQEENVLFLGGVPSLQKLHSSMLLKISNLLTTEFFTSGTVIVREGDYGDKFYIIRVGTVTITKKTTIENCVIDEPVGTLTRGCFFGELALKENYVRQATVTAQTPGVECLVLDRRSFEEYLGSLEDLFNVVYKSEPLCLQRISILTNEYSYIRQQDLIVVGLIGKGGFGKVELVQYIKDRSLTFARKCIKKVEVCNKKQQEHVFNEKNILFSCNSPFICRLYQTYKDNKFVYFLMEVCMGGDLWRLLIDHRFLDDNAAQFMAACVTEALDYLHSRGIIYRDLKPENVALDYRGYAKLVDFGSAKRLTNAKTWTFCSVSYLAPEIILNRGYDRAVDYWALGIFIYELLTGESPFNSVNQVESYNKALAGIEKCNFSPKISKNAQNIIKKLCRPHFTTRLGYQKDGINGIRNHKWFDKFDWIGLQECKLKAPIINPFKGPTDMTNFYRQEVEEDLPPDVWAEWDKDF